MRAQSPAWPRTFNLCGLGPASALGVASLVGDHRMGLVEEKARTPRLPPAPAHAHPGLSCPHPGSRAKGSTPKSPSLQWVGPAPGAHVLGTTEKPLLPAHQCPSQDQTEQLLPLHPAAPAGPSLLTAPQVPVEGDTTNPVPPPSLPPGPTGQGCVTHLSARAAWPWAGRPR